MLVATDVTARYSPDGPLALDGASLSVRPGEVVSLVGANGSGKSTLGALLVGMRLADAGLIEVDGCDPARDAASRREVRRRVGFVRQHPFDQLVSTVVYDEVAFGPRNLGVRGDELRSRVARALARVGLEGYERRDTTALSGGEQQLLAFAGVLAMQPSYLVLDEASSMLDSSARPRHRALVRALADDGLGIVQITHDPLEVLASDRAVVLEAGRIRFDGSPLTLVLSERSLWDETIVANPCVEALRAVCALGYHASAPVDLYEAMSWLIDALKGSCVDAQAGATVLARMRAALLGAGRTTRPHGAAAASLQSVCYSYDRARRALDGVSVDVHAGEVLLIAGASGSGKSTLSCVAAGLIEPDAGSVEVAGARVRTGDVGVAFQRPEDQLFCESVADELAFAPRNLGCDEGEVDARVRRAADLVGLPSDLMDRYPFELSGGQARRVAVASVLSLGARVYLLDEPTAGLDAAGRFAMHELARTLAGEGLAVAVISHDIEEWLAVADRVVLMSAGRVVWGGSPDALVDDPDAFACARMEEPQAIALVRRLAGELGGGAR